MHMQQYKGKYMENEKNEAKENNLETKKRVSVLKNFVFWILTILFLELSYRFSMDYEFNVDSIMNVIIYSTITSAFLSMISRIFKDKTNNWITAIILIVFGTLFSIQCVFTKIFTTNFTLSNLALGDQAAGFIGDALERYI